MELTGTIPAADEDRSRPRAVAPAWHTVVMLVVLGGLSIRGARKDIMGFGRVHIYLLIIAAEWVTVAYIWYGLHLRGVRILELVGGSWAKAGRVLRDVAIGIGFMVLGVLTLSGLGHLLGDKQTEATRHLLPRSRLEVVLWILVSLTAGFCEEFVHRGYFQRQFGALTKSVAGGIVLQGIAFGAGHAYQGWKSMLLISLYGCMFGVLAEWQKSLRPGMIAHFVEDAIGGLANLHRLK
ncbi:MAG TPA: type II CAAX endopeptidase family protein [Candidatus Sulfotelmatobacter sp.]|nr:type II CAAX endopeptidase family protein [Candidatus Sulfotelmatobacter sp.]